MYSHCLSVDGESFFAREPRTCAELTESVCFKFDAVFSESTKVFVETAGIAHNGNLYLCDGVQFILVHHTEIPFLILYPNPTTGQN